MNRIITRHDLYEDYKKTQIQGIPDEIMADIFKQVTDKELAESFHLTSIGMGRFY